MIYVTSDLHGYPVEKFKAMLSSVGFCDDDYLYVLGDVIDRGSDGISLLRLLMSMPNAQLVLGNHEKMMLDCDFLFEEITDESIAHLTGTKLGTYSTWVANGGMQTLSAIRALHPSQVKYILEYLQDAPLYDVVSVGDRDFILTHSGLGSFDPEKKLSQYSRHDLLWNRPNLNQRYFEDITVIFGHTPTFYYGEEYKGKAIVTDTWIDIDTGAAAGLSPMLLRLDDMKEFYSEEN